MSSDTKAFRLEVRLRNNRLITARERLGFTSAAKAAAALGLNYSDLVRYEGLKMSPLLESGGWRESALRVADAYFADPEDLWPKETRLVSKPRVEAEMSFEQLRRLAASDSSDDDAMALDNLRGLMAKKLTPMELTIIEQRFFGEKTQEQIGQPFMLSRARIGQLEWRALCKLHAAMAPKDAVVVMEENKALRQLFCLVRSKSGDTHLSMSKEGDRYSVACGRIVVGGRVVAWPQVVNGFRTMMLLTSTACRGCRGSAIWAKYVKEEGEP